MKQIMGNLLIAADKTISFTFQSKKLGLLFQFSTNKSNTVRILDDIPVNNAIQVYKSDKLNKVSYNSPATVKLGNFFGLISEKNELFVMTFNSNIIKNNWKISLNMQKEPYGYFLVRSV